MLFCRFVHMYLIVTSMLCGYAHAQSWVDDQGRAVTALPVERDLNQDSQQPQIKAGTLEKNGLWLNATAGKKQPKSNYFTSRYKLDQKLLLDEQGYQVTVDQLTKAGDEFKRIVIMFNSNEKIACGIALNSDHTGDLVRLDTKGQFKIRKAIKFKLPATFKFVKQGDEIEIYLGGKKISDKLTFPYGVDPKVGGYLSVDAQMLRVVGNAMAVSLKHELASKPKQAKSDKATSGHVQAKQSAVHRVRTLRLPVDSFRSNQKIVIHTSTTDQYEIQSGRYVTLKGQFGDQKKTYGSALAKQVIAPDEQTVEIQLTQLGPFCFVKFNQALLGMVPSEATEISLFPEIKQVNDSKWQSVALTNRHPHTPGQPIPKVAMQNVLGWLPPDSFTPSMLHATHDFPVTPPVNDVEHDVKLMHQTGWNVAAVDFTFFADYRVIRQYHMMREWLDATVAQKLDDFYVIPFLEVGTYSHSAKTEGAVNKGGRIEVDATFTAHAMIYMLEQYGNHPNWLKFQGRPVFGVYRVNHNTPAFWQEVREILASYGWDPFIFGDLGSLQTAIHGTFDYDEWRDYGKYMDAIYTFSASLLEVSLDLPPKFRECFAPLKNPPVIGATVRPGYLSARPYNKNWISHRGTEIVVKSWEKALQYEPAFIHATTWNDYNEATQFSNSFSISTSQLEIGRYYLGKYFNKPPLPGKPGEPNAILSYFKVSHGNEPIRFRVLNLPTKNGAQSGRWQLTLLDEQGKVLVTTTSDSLDLTKVDTWMWQWDGNITKAQTRTVKVQLKFIGENNTKTYHHVPDIAMIDGNMYGDELYYLVPLHKLASPDKSIVVHVNGVNSQTARHESLVDLQLSVTGASPEKTHVSVAGNSYLLRLAANLKEEGAWAVPSYGYHGAKISEGDPVKSSRFIDVRQDDWAHGNNYYSAQAQFEDGTVAWSSTVYALPAYDAEDVSAQWVFSPRYKQEKGQFLDRTIRRTPLEAAPGNTPTQYVQLPGKLDVMQLDGRQRFYTDLTALPNGPVAMEVVFRPDAVDREQILCVQRGAQATLIIDAQGYLVARRLPQVRKYPDPYAQVRSRQPLQAGKLYQAIVVFDGSQLKLFLNGKMENQTACYGRRSTEMFVVGGPALPRSLIVDKDEIKPALKQVIREIDGVHERSFYKGLLVRLTLMSRALTTDEVYASFERLQASCFWN